MERQAQGTAEGLDARDLLSGRQIAVVGGGVVGLACAWRAATAGAEVTVYEPDTGGPHGEPDGSAAWVAGGMLAAIAEAWPGEEAVLDLADASLDRWPGFLAELADHGDLTVQTADDTLLVAVDDADVRDLERSVDWALQHRQARAAVGDRGDEDAGDAASGAAVRAVEQLTRREARSAEPSLARVVRRAYRVRGEGAVDNRLLLRALGAACHAAGVSRRQERVEDLAAVPGDRVVLAAGHAAADLAGLPVRPVKGEVLRLRERPGCQPAFTSVVRGRVRGRPVYLVPRAGGLVVGATQYEHGDDRQVTVAGVRDLLADAETLLPGIGEYELGESIAGLRPMSPDNLPIIGPLPGDDRIVAATGHGRNGIALTPVTADLVLGHLAGRDSDLSAAVSPGRFAGTRGKEE